MLAAGVPAKYQRKPAGRSLDPFKDTIWEQLGAIRRSSRSSSGRWPGEFVHCDLWELRTRIPVGHGQHPRRRDGDL
jgi:hypothetical protein